MATPETFVYDLTLAADGAVPRRPTLDDVNPTIENRLPLPLTGQIEAHQANLWARMAYVAGHMLPVAIVDIDFAAGDPFIQELFAASLALVSADLTLTDNADGDTTITWDPDTFPVATFPSRADVAEDGEWLQPTCTAVTNGVRVKTRDKAGVLTDVRVVVRIAGG